MDINDIFNVIFFLIFVIFLFHFGKEYGYNKREKEFQGNPVQFVTGGYPVARVAHVDGEVVIKIFDRKFVKIIEVQ